MRPYRPLARQDLRYRRTHHPLGPCWLVEDRATGRELWFGPFEYRVLQALDGERTVADVATVVGAHEPAERAQLAALIEDLGRAGLLADARARAGQFADRLLLDAEDDQYWGQLGRMAYASAVDILAQLEEIATCDCASCRLPCCSYAVDVTADEWRALAEDVAALGLDPSTVAQRGARGEGGRSLLRLTHRADGQCSLLDGDGRCRIHGVFGIERKPVVCQVYPAHAVVTPDGPRMTVRSGCPYPGLTRDPAARAAHRRVLERMREDRPTLPIPVAPETVALAPGVTGSWADYRAWEFATLETLAQASSAVAGLASAARDLCARFPECAPHIEGGDGDGTGVGARVAGGLSSLLDEGGREEQARVMVAFASGAAAPSPRLAPVDIVANAVHALYPLRFPTVLGGLGGLRLIAALAERDPEAAALPRETLSLWVRIMRAPKIHLALVRSAAGTLERIAVEEGL